MHHHRPSLLTVVVSQSYTQNEDGPPLLLVNLLLGESWTPFLEEVLTGLALQDYPKEAIDVWIYAQVRSVSVSIHI